MVFLLEHRARAQAFRPAEPIPTDRATQAGSPGYENGPPRGTQPGEAAGAGRAAQPKPSRAGARAAASRGGRPGQRAKDLRTKPVGPQEACPALQRQCPSSKEEGERSQIPQPGSRPLGFPLSFGISGRSRKWCCAWRRLSRRGGQRLDSRKSSELKRSPLPPRLDISALQLAARMADRAALEERVRLQGEHVRELKQQKASAEQVRPGRQGRGQSKAGEEVERGGR